MVKALQATFKAWIDQSAGHDTTIVVGELEEPAVDQTLELREAVSQGQNPAILVLDICSRDAPERAGDRTDPRKVRFEKQGTYRDVTIRNGGPNFTIPVAERAPIVFP